MNKTYTAVHYEKFKNLLSIAENNHRKAMLLDKFIFWLKTSYYTLPHTGPDIAWFTRTYESIKETTGIPLSTLKRYVKELETSGFLVRIQKKFQNEVRVYFRLTDKLFSLVGNTQRSVNGEGGQEGKCKNLSQNEIIKDPTMRLPTIYKRTESSVNTIKPFQGCGKHKGRYNVPKAVESIFSKIGERLEDVHKTQIWAAICNLQKQHKKQISNIAEFTAWVSFSLIHAKHQLKSRKSFTHQLNTLMKIARTPEGLKKPKGFDNHWDIGKELKAQATLKQKAHEKNKRPQITQRIDVQKSIGDDMAYVVAKKADELWDDETKLKTLKSKANGLRVEISSLSNHLKRLDKVFASDPDELERQKAFTFEQRLNIQQQLTAVSEEISLLEEDRTRSEEQSWQPLYA